MSQEPKIFKKGDLIFREGDKILNILLIQSGGVSLSIVKPKKNIEMFQLGPGQVLGEQALSGATTHTFSAIATAETKILEIPVAVYRQSVDQSQQMIKVLVKSLVDRTKMAASDLRSFKLEKDASPCPEDQVAKIYGSLFHSINHKGTKDPKNPKQCSVDWVVLKQYAQRIFAESPKRLEQAICILVKLKLANFEMGKPPEDPEGPDQIMKVHFVDSSVIESFFEFYQYYYFKGGKTELLKYDESSFNLVHHFVHMAADLTPDRMGLVTMDYARILEGFKTDLNINLNNDHFARLEQKGVFLKRVSRPEGSVVLQFELAELKTTIWIWKLLREIEKWNEKGFVDMNEEVVVKKKSEGPSCPQCASSIPTQAKFCPECGFKIAA